MINNNQSGIEMTKKIIETTNSIKSAHKDLSKNYILLCQEVREITYGDKWKEVFKGKVKSCEDGKKRSFSRHDYYNYLADQTGLSRAYFHTAANNWQALMDKFKTPDRANKFVERLSNILQGASSEVLIALNPREWEEKDILLDAKKFKNSWNLSKHIRSHYKYKASVNIGRIKAVQVAFNRIFGIKVKIELKGDVKTMKAVFKKYGPALNYGADINSVTAFQRGQVICHALRESGVV
jgi:hypothetical protein